MSVHEHDIRPLVRSIGTAPEHWRRADIEAEAARRSLRNAIDDAHLAAVAISRGATLASFDLDFACFVEHGLRWEHLGAK